MSSGTALTMALKALLKIYEAAFGKL